MLRERRNNETSAPFRRTGREVHAPSLSGRRDRHILRDGQTQKRSATEPARSSSATGKPDITFAILPLRKTEQRRPVFPHVSKESATHTEKEKSGQRRHVPPRQAKCNPPFFLGAATIPERPITERHAFPQETKREAQPFRHPFPACLTGTKPPCGPSHAQSHSQTHPQRPVPAGTTTSETKKRRNSPSFSSRKSGRAALRRSGSRS